VDGFVVAVARIIGRDPGDERLQQEYDGQRGQQDGDVFRAIQIKARARIFLR
jgi:hypothetical protein